MAGYFERGSEHWLDLEHGGKGVVLTHVPPSRLRRLSVLRNARTCELLVENGTLNLDSGWDGKGLPSENLRGTELAHVSGLNNLSTTLTWTPDIVPSKRC